MNSPPLRALTSPVSGCRGTLVPIDAKISFEGVKDHGKVSRSVDTGAIADGIPGIGLFGDSREYLEAGNAGLRESLKRCQFGSKFSVSTLDSRKQHITDRTPNNTKPAHASNSVWISESPFLLPSY